MNSKSLSMITALSNANGVSGFEDEVLTLVREYGAGLGEFAEDHMRNLILKRRGNTGKKPVVMLDAHTDEVGFMVQSIKPNGSLGFIPLGGWVASNVPAHKMRVRTKDGSYIPGIVGSKPPHFTSEAERKAAPLLENMSIDIGATTAAEAEARGVRIGEPVVPDVTFEAMALPGRMLGKAFDCRLGCAALLDTLHELKDDDLGVDIVASFAVQEELGLRGAKVQANRIRPDVAIVFEAAPADDSFASPGTAQNALGKGPMLRHIDSTMLANPRLMRLVLELAEKEGIPVQQAVRTTGGTNAGAIHLAGEGVPVVVIGLPVRYLHTHYGIATAEDYDAGLRLAAAILRALDEDAVKAL